MIRFIQVRIICRDSAGARGAGDVRQWTGESETNRSTTLSDEDSQGSSDLDPKATLCLVADLG